MTKSQTISARLGLAMLGAGMLLSAAPALAQTGNPGADNPGEALSRNLRSLAENPKSLHALMGAGKAALELGDPQAAITFFGRAEEQAPRDGRIKMWLGAALVQMQQAQGALKFFAEATSMGAPEAEVAGVRGLAYDLLGDPRRAQRDYRLALQSQPNAEVSRRLALSLAISGEREAALQALEGQLLIRDRAAERTRMFVLALTGDVAGASRAVQATMPAQSAAMTPFLQRLPALSQSERALAVHLGHFPSHARNLPVPAPNVYAAYEPSPTRAGAPDSRQTALGSRAATPGKAQSRPAVTQPQKTPATASAQPQRLASVVPAKEKPKAEPARRTQPTTAGSSSVNPQWALSRGGLPVRRTEPAAPKPTEEKPKQQLALAAPQPKPFQPQVSKSSPAPAQQQVATAAAAPIEPPRQIVVADATPLAQPQPGASASPASAQVQQQLATAAPQIQSPVQTVSLAPSAAAATPGFSISAAAATATAVQQEPLPELASVEAPPPASGVGEENSASRLAGIASLIASLPETAPAGEEAAAPEPVRAAAKPSAKPPVTAAAAKETPTKPAAKKPAAVVAKKEAPAAAKKTVPAVARKPSAPAEPSRIWVQVAGGADKTALPREFARLRTKAPKVLAARSAWTTPLKATNRLLVGPFKTDGDAQAFVNELKKAELSGFAWTSDAGQKIEKLPAK